MQIMMNNVDPGKAWNNRKGSIKNSRLLSQIGESFKESFTKSPISFTICLFLAVTVVA